ncbi:MAG: RluA family pseudouridine synthase [Bacteroidaceae bacterium]|nr:RluA family pseudouridine synthase [Bacteroidaceae bacterium]
MRRNSKPQTTSFKVKQESIMLDFIMTALDGISRNKAKAILTGSGVTVNERLVKQHDYRLKVGDQVEISKQKNRNSFSSKFVKLVYEDAYIIVIEKNVGILSMASNSLAFSVKSELDNYLRKSHQGCTAHVVHRLDRETSGLLVYAKTIEAEQILEHNWHEIVTDRRYVALVSGVPEQKKGSIESWLKDNKAYITYSSPTDNGGKYALTHYKVLKSDGKRSLVELKLETGRKNQIRVHLQDIGTPVCGDMKYGNGDNPIGRLGLHAFRLNFYHPITGKQLTFETELPKQFINALERKEKPKKEEEATQ